MDQVQQPMPTQYDMQPPPVYTEQPPPSPMNLQTILALVANMKVDVLKEPKGFMKILQFFFTICAFATTTSYSSVLAFLVKCEGDKKNQLITIPIEYNFRLDHLREQQDICGAAQQILIRGDASSDAEFYVAIGVIAWLFVIGALILYMVFNPLYASNPLYPVIDCAIHLVFAVLWLAASAAWSSSLSTLKSATSFDTILAENKHICGDEGKDCTLSTEPNYGKLDISIIFGFLNMFLFASNMWFLYKETPYFQARQQANQQQQFMPPDQQGVPQQQLPQQY